MKEADIVAGRAYTGKRWQGARKVVRVVRERGPSVVHYVDLRTSRTGNAPLELFAVNAEAEVFVPSECGEEIVATIKLSEAQKRVLKWIGKGWRTEPGPGSAVMVNGKRICNTDTMMALKRAGLASVDDQGCWMATVSGKAIAAEQGL